MKNRFLGCAAVFLAASPALGASSVDESLEEIAVQIVERMKGDASPTIGISTFTHGDRTCSNLSNYVTEAVVDSIFVAGAGELDIIERSQLSAIFREMELVFDGTIAPDTAKRLGEIEGVDAVVTGTLIEFGETIKVQARLLSTESGRLFATAKSDFPSVGSVADMMSERSRNLCGFSGSAASEIDSSSTTETAALAPGTVRQTAPVFYENATFRVEPASVYVWDDGTGLSLTLEVTNLTSKDIVVGGQRQGYPYATTKLGDTFDARVNGLNTSSSGSGGWVTLQPGGTLTTVYQISKSDNSEILGSILSLRSALRIRTNGGNSEEQTFILDEIAIK